MKTIKYLVTLDSSNQPIDELTNLRDARRSAKAQAASGYVGADAFACKVLGEDESGAYRRGAPVARFRRESTERVVELNC